MPECRLASRHTWWHGSWSSSSSQRHDQRESNRELLNASDVALQQDVGYRLEVISPRILCPQRAVKQLIEQPRHNCAMKIVILVAWIIWKCRNGWMFYNIPPTIERCRDLLAQELKLLQHILKPCIGQNLESWMHSVHLS
jgi:hypothetical protein